nr:hypothetical protein [uncultured Rhodococcus sp.]
MAVHNSGMVALGVLLTGLLAGLSMQSDGIDIFGDTRFGGLLFSSGGVGVAAAANHEVIGVPFSSWLTDTSETAD